LTTHGRALGYACQLPQFLAVLALARPDMRPLALGGGFAYGALALCFSGGIWWGIALSNPRAPRWVYQIAVLPGVIALVACTPLILGRRDVGVPLAIVGAALFASPIADRELALQLAVPQGWLAMRLRLAFGLGALTLLLAAFALCVQPTL